MQPCRLCLYEIGTNVYCSVCAEYNCAPAQEEKEMDDYQLELGIAEDTAERERKKAKKRRRKLRERWDRAFYAALTGFCAAQPIPGVMDFDPMGNAQWVANETIRRHADMMAARDAIIAEVVG